MVVELISVIIPVYKVEAYLDRCLESITTQTYRDLEIILVDDGSPDRCPQMCDQWAQRDSRIRVIHKPNGGVSSARNAGLEAATGKWFYFVDSDDFLPENALEALMERQQKYDADLVCGSFHIIKRGNKSFDKIYPEKTVERQAFGENLPFLMKEVYGSACGKLFSMELVKNHQLAFPVGIPWGEDATFFYRYLTHVSTVVTTGHCVYHYDMIREDSAVKKYYENLSQLAQQLFGEQKAFIGTVGGDQEMLIRNLARDRFESCLIHYSLYETDRQKRKEKIRESAELFPEAAGHVRYGKAVRKQQWLRAANQWRRDNFKWYLKEVLKRHFGLFR